MIRTLIVLGAIAYGLYALAGYIDRRIQRQEYEATAQGFEATLRMIDVDLAKMNHQLEDLL